MQLKKLKSNDQKVPKQAEAKRGGVINPQNYKSISNADNFMLSKRYE